MIGKQILTIPFLLSIFLLSSMSYSPVQGQEIPILNYATSSNGQIEIEVASSSDHYYLLEVTDDLLSQEAIITSISLGDNETTTLTEPLNSYPIGHYKVLQYLIDTPVDTDGDGLDDTAEYIEMPFNSPLNAAMAIDVEDGIISVESFARFKQLSFAKEFVPWSEFLNGKSYMKFIIEDFFSSTPKLYFINGNTHDLHKAFAESQGIPYGGDNIVKGQIIYHPTVISENGTLGTFTFNYSNGKAEDFDVVRKSYNLLGRSMPFLNNNLSYFITELNTDAYLAEEEAYSQSRIPILFEEDLYGELDYWGLNQAEGYGLFRKMPIGETPGATDIVLYDVIPNSLPRVAGVMTSYIQSPLSHVNLRAAQNGLPNAFIRDPLSIDSVASLLGQYVYYRVDQDNFTIREASLEEVNNWFEDIRPKEEQLPPLNLSYQKILPLSEIGFGMYDGFGSKCANVATMLTFGFPDKTIPDGHGIPFYFYKEFMEYNGFFEQVASIIDNVEFENDRDIREDRLQEFRKVVKKGDLPDWMYNNLSQMQESYPEGVPIRCRSSSNNEDLPNFSGAGLYNSKTQYPDEGHIEKSIKQVFASIWSLRAFEEREFYRVDHFKAAMGVLCHPNYSDEHANGVGVSADPVYQTDETFYLNAQIGEDLITNPVGDSTPEEILLDRNSYGQNDYIILRRSNLISDSTTVMKDYHLDQMRDLLSVIHDEFAILYGAEEAEDFAVDIEFKITQSDQLIIKQARPWPSYRRSITPGSTDQDSKQLVVYPNPSNGIVNIRCDECNLSEINVYNYYGAQLLSVDNVENPIHTFILPSHLPVGPYVVAGVGSEQTYFTTVIIR